MTFPGASGSPVGDRRKRGTGQTNSPRGPAEAARLSGLVFPLLASPGPSTFAPFHTAEVTQQ